MPELPPILVAGITGLISGFFLSIPVGPINLTIMNEGARRGFKWACLIGLGAAFMEVLYCAIAFTGFSSFFANALVKAAMEVFSFVFLLFLGFKFLLVKDIAASARLAASADVIEKRIGQRFHPTSAFMTGFVRTMGNLGVLLFWIILSTNFMLRGWVQPNFLCKLACVTGVGLGITLWFTILSRAVSIGQGRFSEKTLLRIEHFSGIGLIALSLFNGSRIVWQLARHKM
jgi:threonine/homoserine/homoserine lactone efflux protein